METEKIIKKWLTLNILNQSVTIKRIETGKRIWFCAYVELKDSNVLNESFLGYPTYRKEDVVGVDTGHAFNENHTEAEKLSSALSQIESIIKVWNKAINGVFEE
jgi:hypothetical protein